MPGLGQCQGEAWKDAAPDSRGHQKPNNDLEHLQMMQRLRDTAWQRHERALASPPDYVKGGG